MLNAVLSFIAGLLTAFAPCVLPLLPIILGGSIAGDGQKNRYRPYIITASLVISLIIFTYLLKVSTSLIGIDPRVWKYLSGSIVIVLGVAILFPSLWDQLIGRLGLQRQSQGLLTKAFQSKTSSTLSAVLTGAALGPVFSSCSPTYSWVIATVLPQSAAKGFVYLAIYCLGVAVSLLAIALLGRRLLSKIKWITNPHGIFQRLLGIVFLIVGLAVITGYDKRVQTWAVDKDFLNLIRLEQKLVPEAESGTTTKTSNGLANKAPEIISGGEWFNSAPLTIESLKGKVVVVDFWTYSCINCLRTLPYLSAWHEAYADDGLVIIGVHAPEFAFEKVASNVQKAITDLGIKYPVVQDNNFATWRSYNNQYWPAKYFINRDGVVVDSHFGEGEYQESEDLIRKLLAEKGIMPESRSAAPTEITKKSLPLSAETYLGSERAEIPSIANYSGGIIQDSEGITSTVGGQLTLDFTAAKVYLVIGSTDGTDKKVDLDIDGAKTSIVVNQYKLYTLYDGEYLPASKMTIDLPSGTKANAFTFDL
jgi:cytochrome c biogenesis protein CcdA/thiol-disulfide isomerase/thioredoxin